MNVSYRRWFGVCCAGLALLGTVGAWASTSTVEETESSLAFVKKHFGLNYNSFFAGPGVNGKFFDTPGMTGTPSDTGWNLFNLISLRYKITPKFGLDLQLREQQVLTNQFEWRHQGQRLGIFATFLKGETYSLAGALNSDIPIPGLFGQIQKQRTQLFNPGLFSFFSWNPKGSKWSVFSVVAPRIWIYEDRQALSKQDILAGGAFNKPEYTFYLNPSINYATSENTGVRLGTTLEYTKFVANSGVIRNFMPFELGFTYDVNEMLSIYPYIYTSTPLDDGLREGRGFGGTPWHKTLSLNLWLSGKLF